jgi:hypothetical protein
MQYFGWWMGENDDLVTVGKEGRGGGGKLKVQEEEVE